MGEGHKVLRPLKRLRGDTLQLGSERVKNVITDREKLGRDRELIFKCKVCLQHISHSESQVATLSRLSK